jgi:hypothetical protein
MIQHISLILRWKENSHEPSLRLNGVLPEELLHDVDLVKIILIIKASLYPM